MVEADKSAISVGFGTSGLTAPAGRGSVSSPSTSWGAARTRSPTPARRFPGFRAPSQSVPGHFRPPGMLFTDSNSVDYAIAVPDGPSATLSLTAAGFLPVLLAHRGSTGRRPAGQPLRSGERASSQEPRRGGLLVLRARYSALEEDGRPGRPRSRTEGSVGLGVGGPRCHEVTSGTGTSGSATS